MNGNRKNRLFLLRQDLSNTLKNCWYVTIEKVYQLGITNYNIINSLQTSSLNRAIKSRKQQSNPVTVEDRRTY